MKIDTRFDRRIWKANLEIITAFGELAEDISDGRIDNAVADVSMLHDIYKEKANQAKKLLTRCLDLLVESHVIIPTGSPEFEKHDAKRLSE